MLFSLFPPFCPKQIIKVFVILASRMFAGLTCKSYINQKPPSSRGNLSSVKLLSWVSWSAEERGPQVSERNQTLDTGLGSSYGGIFSLPPGRTRKVRASEGSLVTDLTW